MLFVCVFLLTKSLNTYARTRLRCAFFRENFTVMPLHNMSDTLVSFADITTIVWSPDRHEYSVLHDAARRKD